MTKTLITNIKGPAGIPGLHLQDVAGPVTIPVEHEHTYEVTATATAALTLTGVPGTHAAIFWHGVAGTVEGIPLVADTIAVAVRAAAGWKIFVVGAAATDTTPPTAGTLSVTTTASSADLTVVGAMDDVALHAQAYGYSSDNGSSWSAWSADSTATLTGLTADTTYDFRHRVRDAAGNVRIGTKVAKATDIVRTWTLRSQYDFTAADGTLVTAVSPVAGDLSLTTPSGSLPAKIVGNKMSTYAQAVQQSSYQRWDLSTHPQPAGHRITFDYASPSTDSTTPVLSVTVPVLKEDNQEDIVTLTLSLDTTWNAVIRGENAVYTPAAGKPSALPLSGTIRFEIVGTHADLYFGGVLQGTYLFDSGRTLRGVGLGILTANAWITVDNASFEVLQ